MIPVVLDTPLIHGSHNGTVVNEAGEETYCLHNISRVREGGISLMIFPPNYFHKSLSFIPRRLKLFYDPSFFSLLLNDFYKLANVKVNYPTLVLC